MSQEGTSSRALEVTVTEKVLARLRTQVLVLYLVSLGLGLALGLSLVWEHRVLTDLTNTRLSEYRLFVAEKLDELHRLDLEEVARKTRPERSCDPPLPREDVEALLRGLEGGDPAGSDVAQLLDKAESFGVCDIGEVQHILEDRENMARVDTVYRILLQRAPDTVGRFIYGYWLASGVGVEAVARDIMTSPEFFALRRLAES